MQHHPILRQIQINSRLFTAIFLLNLIFVILFFIANRNSLSSESEKHTALHKYLAGLFKARRSRNDDNGTRVDADELIWSNETVELFQDQLGLTLLMEKSDDKRKIKCENEFMLSALPGAEEENFYEALWQFFSLDSLEHVTIICDDGGKKLSLKAVVTERVKLQLEKLFEGSSSVLLLPLQMITTYPSGCYDLKYTKIIGNISPIELKGVERKTPFLLDPAAKRWREISQRWAIKIHPYWKIKRSFFKDINDELMVTKTLLEIESSRDNDLNYVGIYITADDKLPAEYYKQAMDFHRKNALTLFLVICDAESFTFCRETFEHHGKSTADKEDARISHRSNDPFDFALMASCNATIVSNEMGVLHALMNGGITTVFRPNFDYSYSVPFLMSEQMENWYAISVAAV